MQSKVANVVEQKLTGFVESLGYELYEVDYSKKQNGMNLTLFITAKDGHTISLKDCEIVHRAVDSVLDEIDPTNGAGYYLNVSSVGLDKPLKSDKDFERCKGTMVEVKQFVQDDNGKDLVGTLKGYSATEIMIEIGGVDHVVLRKNVALCKPFVKV